MLAQATEPQILVWAFQTAAGLVLMMTTGIAIWALKEVYRLRGDVERIKATIEGVDRRFEDVKGWLKAISEKLDRLNQFMMQCPRRAGKPCLEDTP